MRILSNLRLTTLRNENKERAVKSVKPIKPRKGKPIKVDMRGLDILTR